MPLFYCINVANCYFSNSVATTAGFEPATFAVTGQRSNQLNYVAISRTKYIYASKICHDKKFYTNINWTYINFA